MSYSGHRLGRDRAIYDPLYQDSESEDGSHEEDGPGGDEDEGDDPFDEEEGNLENPLQAPSAQEDRGPASNSPIQDKSLYVEVGRPSQDR